MIMSDSTLSNFAGILSISGALLELRDFTLVSISDFMGGSLFIYAGNV